MSDKVLAVSGFSLMFIGAGLGSPLLGLVGSLLFNFGLLIHIVKS